MNLTEYLLTCLIEECGEVAKECCKAQRFGIDDQHEGLPVEYRIVEELAHVEAVVELLNRQGLLLHSAAAKRQLMHAKQRKLDGMMEYSRKAGLLQ